MSDLKDRAVARVFASPAGPWKFQPANKRCLLGDYRLQLVETGDPLESSYGVGLHLLEHNDSVFKVGLNHAEGRALYNAVEAAHDPTAADAKAKRKRLRAAVKAFAWTK